MDPTENAVSLLMWVMWYRVLHCGGTVHLVPDHVAILPSAALLLLRDVTADADVMCSSVACKHGSAVAVSADKTILAGFQQTCHTIIMYALFL
jgi:hypothetical protein